MLATSALIAAAWLAGPRTDLATQSSRGPSVARSGPRFAPDARMQVGPYDQPMSEMELAEQSAKLDALAAKWSRRQQMKEAEDAGQIGWVKAAEATNGRFAMFFLPVGLITEYYTGESVPQQVYTLLQTLGFVEVRWLGVAICGAARKLHPPVHMLIPLLAVLRSEAEAEAALTSAFGAGQRCRKNREAPSLPSRLTDVVAL
jgi:hypothetical protein